MSFAIVGLGDVFLFCARVYRVLAGQPDVDVLENRVLLRRIKRRASAVNEHGTRLPAGVLYFVAHQLRLGQRGKLRDDGGLRRAMCEFRRRCLDMMMLSRVCLGFCANAELIRNVVRCQMEKTKEEVKECILGFMDAYHETIRKGISGGGICNLLEQQASASVERAAQLSPELVNDGRLGLNIAMVSLPNTYEYSRLTECKGSKPEGPARQGKGLALNDCTEPDPASDIDVGFESRHLEDYFTWEHVHPHLHTLTSPLLADASFVDGLEAFTAATDSRLLYAHGQYYFQGADPLRQWTSGYMSLAQAAGVPVVSYFCELSADEPPVTRTRKSMELSALICALIRQLVNLLPVGDPKTAAAFDAARFLALDGTLRTWKEALGVFENLVEAVCLPLMLFVIHGLNVGEDEFEHSTAEALVDLVKCFARISGPAFTHEGRICKVLFTTSDLTIRDAFLPAG